MLGFDVQSCHCSFISLPNGIQILSYSNLTKRLDFISEDLDTDLDKHPHHGNRIWARNLTRVRLVLPIGMGLFGEQLA